MKSLETYTCVKFIFPVYNPSVKYDFSIVVTSYSRNHGRVKRSAGLSQYK